MERERCGWQMSWEPDKERGDSVFKWSNQGSIPSVGGWVCVCVCLGRVGCTWTDWVQVPLQLSTYPSSALFFLHLLFPPSSPERPKLLYPSTTHSGLNKAAPHLSPPPTLSLIPFSWEHLKTVPIVKWWDDWTWPLRLLFSVKISIFLLWLTFGLRNNEGKSNSYKTIKWLLFFLKMDF